MGSRRKSKATAAGAESVDSYPSPTTGDESLPRVSMGLRLTHGDENLFLPLVILSITTPVLSRQTFPWTSCAPLCFPSRFSFLRSILAALSAFWEWFPTLE